MRPPNAIYDRSLLPTPLSAENYRYVWDAIPIGRMLLNTFQMAIMQTVAQLMTALLAAYAFARWTFRGDRILFLAFVGTWLIPFQVTMIPNYVTLARLGWLNTVWAIVVPQLTAAFAIVMLRQHLKAFPRSSSTRPAPTVRRAGRRSGASSSRTSARRSRHWPSCSSSRPGTSTSGRCSS